jgi:hypothetical protein
MNNMNTHVNPPPFLGVSNRYKGPSLQSRMKKSNRLPCICRDWPLCLTASLLNERMNVGGARLRISQNGTAFPFCENYAAFRNRSKKTEE